MIAEVLLTIGIVLLTTGGVLVYRLLVLSRLPENHPKEWLNRSEESNDKVVVCAGDSLTHGRVSYDYVADLRRHPDLDGYAVVNGGVNSELAWNLLNRIDDIVECNPDLVTILIGTNDANTTLSENNVRRMVKKMGLKRVPNKVWFRDNLEKICLALQERTGARIALLSLPPIGETAGDAPFQVAAEYSAVVREVAKKTGVTYLPLHEKMTGWLQQHPGQPVVSYYDWLKVMRRGFLSLAMGSKTLDEISAENGFELVTDFLHLNRRGGEMIRELILDFIRTAPRGGEDRP